MKTSNFVILLLCAAMVSVTATAQRRMRTINPADTLRSIVSNADGSVSFRIYAPQAQAVSLAGDFSGLNAVFTKGDDGIWTARVPKVNTDAYRYHFVVDGVKVIDPRWPLYNEILPVARITNGEDIFWERHDVPHGPIQQISYHSTTTGQTRSMHVWTPAGNAAWKPLPVLYLIHGGGDNDASWTGIGCAADILDNLYAEGKIKPMIVVMPHGGMDTNLFVDELVNDIMPRIAWQYRIKSGAANTALAGLSMGGLETLNIFIRYPERFGYINVMSSGWFGSDDAALKGQTEQLRKIAPKLRKSVRLLRFTMGGREDFAWENCQKTLKCFDDAGIKYEYSETRGGHSWHVWHYDLRDFALRLFK
jgi:enterochelin esterase family protein